MKTAVFSGTMTVVAVWIIPPRVILVPPLAVHNTPPVLNPLLPIHPRVGGLEFSFVLVVGVVGGSL